MHAEVNLEHVFRPRKVGEDRFEALSMPLERGTIYGGQLLAQVLAAAAGTLPAPQPAHYLQTTFVSFGDALAPLELAVRRVRDGRSTCQRHVEVTQHGRTLLLATLSFQDPADGFEHQMPMPDVPAAKRLAQDPANFIPFGAPEGNFPFLILDCAADSASREPAAAIWARPREEIPAGELLHQMCFAFLSDSTILQAAMQPHDLDWQEDNVFVATMNHTIWFHRHIDINDWMLLCGESPSTSHGRALCVANAFTADGTLFATVAQEGALRTRKR